MVIIGLKTKYCVSLYKLFLDYFLTMTVQSQDKKIWFKFFLLLPVLSSSFILFGVVFTCHSSLTFTHLFLSFLSSLVRSFIFLSSHFLVCSSSLLLFTTISKSVFGLFFNHGSTKPGEEALV